MGTRRRRLGLALVAASESFGAVGVFGWRGEVLEGDLPDRHALVERKREAGDVGEFECQGAVPSGVDESGGGVNEQSDAAQRAFAFETGDYRVVKGDALQGVAEDELTGVQDEGLIVGDLNHLVKVGDIFTEVYVWRGGVAEHEHFVVEMEVNRCGLHIGGIKGRYADPSALNLVSDALVAQYHYITNARPTAHAVERAISDSNSAIPGLFGLVVCVYRRLVHASRLDDCEVGGDPGPDLNVA